MISDTLSDAACEIREYLTNMPHVYKPGAALDAINHALEAMEAARVILDTPPEDDPS